MQNYENLVQWISKLSDQIIQLKEENQRLKENNQHLKDEIAVLKGQKPRPKISPSSLEGSGKKENEDDKPRPPRGKHPRQKKTNRLDVHNKQRIKPESLPADAVFKGLSRYTVQDIIFEPNNTVYELERWMLPNGTYVTGQLPKNILGHYGPKLVTYILYQYYGCRVTEPLLFAQLKERGVLISRGQLSNILTQGKETFHDEKDELLAAGIAATDQIKVDDTGSRHKGKNGYSTIIGNEYFTSIVSTESKSRINFLQILHGTDLQYLINEDAVDYIEALKPANWLGGHLLMLGRDRSMNQEDWKKFLLEIDITKEADIRLATEAALFASLIESGIPKHLGVHGDDAGQFNAFVRSLCWVHEERHYRKLVPFNEAARTAVEQVRGDIWDLYKALQAYKIAPSESLKLILSQSFDDLFLRKKTISPALNHLLSKTYAKKDELLRVLERPETPLHNNGTETDAREMVIKRKVSGGTRSEEGRKARDTFISLKKTCSKLGITFWNYLEDRVHKLFTIDRLAQIIASISSMHHKDRDKEAGVLRAA